MFLMFVSPFPVPNLPVEFQSSSFFYPASLAAVTGFKKMAATKQESKSITLKGSAELVTEFFGNFLYVWIFDFVWFYSKLVLFFSFFLFGRIWDKQVSFCGALQPGLQPFYSLSSKHVENVFEKLF